MRLNHKIHLARLYFSRHIRRYMFLIISLALGFAVITAMTSLSRGMGESVSRASRSHYGGDLVLIGYDKDHGNRMRLVDEDLAGEALDASGLEPATVLARTNYYREGILYFSGNGVRQKNVLGVDFDREKSLLEGMDFTAGSPGEAAAPGSLLVSELTARDLGCRLGDDVVLRVLTLTGQVNTVTLEVGGIFRDSSIFGAYKCFMDRETLSGLLNYPGLTPSSLGYFFETPPSAGEIEAFYGELSRRLPMAPPIATKEELTYQLDHQNWESIRYFLIPLSVYISQVDDLLMAMDLVSYFLYVMTSIIIFLSTSVTYRLILKERTRETGTMRALGIHPEEMVEILLWESLILFAVSLILGALAALGLTGIANMVDFSSIPAFEIFLTRGRLVPSYKGGTIFFNIGLLAAIILPSVLIPAVKSVRAALINSLSRES